VTDGIRFRQLRGIAEGFHHRIAQVVRRYEFGARALRDFDCITDMIGMSVCDQDQFNPLERCDFLLASLVNGIRQPGIDKKNITARRNDLKSRLPIPGQLSFHTNHKIEKIPLGKGDEKNDEAPAFAALRRGRQMTNDEGISKSGSRNMRSLAAVLSSFGTDSTFDTRHFN